MQLIEMNGRQKDICFILLSLDRCNVKNKGGRSMLSFLISDNFGKKRDNVFASIVF